MFNPKKTIKKVLLFNFLIFFVLVFSSMMNLDAYVRGDYMSTNEKWVFYVFSPPTDYTERTVTWGAAGTIVRLSSNGTEVIIVGYNSSTMVNVYDITGGQHKIIESFTINRMGEKHIYIPIGTYLKIAANNPISVLIRGGIMYSLVGSRIFYPSTDGGFAGKEFIIYVPGGTGWSHIAFGIESGSLIVYDKEGRIVKEARIKADSAISLPIVKEGVYRIVSTGRILIYSAGSGGGGSHIGANGFEICPSVLGGKIGREFFSFSPRLLIISQESSCKVRIIELEKGNVIAEKDLLPREVWFINGSIASITTSPTSNTPKPVKIESTGNIIVYSCTTAVPTGESDDMQWLSSGVAFIGIKPNEIITLYIPSQVILFSPETNAEVEIGGIKLFVKRGEYRDLPMSGSLTIRSNTTLLLQVISRISSEDIGTTASPNYIYVDDVRTFGSYLITPQSIFIEYPPPEKTKEEEDNTVLIMAGAIVIVVAFTITTVFFLRRRQAKNFKV